MATSTVIPGERTRSRRRASRGSRVGLDYGVVTGIVIALIALVVGIAATGINIRYFFQPTSGLIVIGGSLGVLLITTPFATLSLAFRRTRDLLSTDDSPDREELIEEIVSLSKAARIQGILAIEPEIDQVSHGFLREAILLALDAKEHGELQSALENKIRFGEKQSETAAKVLEVAGGFTPAIGVLGTVIGLIDVLRQFSSLSMVAYGVGAAFTSTFYGLVLANFVLLPAACRIRARAAETFDLQEMMMDGALCLFDGMHPRLVRQRLRFFLSEQPERDEPVRNIESASGATQS